MPYWSQHSAFVFALGLWAVLAFPAARATPAAPAVKLPPVVSVALERAHIPVSAVAIWVQPVDAAQPTLAINAGKPMNPASVMKVVTTFVALEQLGPERIWRTRIAASGPVRGSVLAGDLYVIGDGDPVLTYERLWRLLRRLRMLGIAEIGGDIVLDHSALAFPAHDPNVFDGRGLRPYNSGGDGLLMHFNAQELALFPGSQPQEPVRLVEEPPLAGVAIDNQIVTSGKSCEPWYRDLDAHLEDRRLVLTGSLSASCGPRIWATAPLAPADFGAAMVQALWRELGGTVRGTVRGGIAPKGATTLIADDSAPLGEIVRTMNKWSNNVIARQLLAQLGRGNPAPADSVGAGIEAARQRLAEARIDISGLVIDNGAGLSRNARIRADSLGTLLIRAWQRPWMPEFLASLPVAGRDGTTRRRLVDSPVRGYAHLKTGTINEVKAIAGYVLDQYGRRHALVMMVNHPQAANSGKAQDALIEWVWTADAPLSVRPVARRGKR
ncbi:MAG: D-alanyl-D-alanine carboxypeptidase/D-alanyl-D-alanine-endopeptidase [Azoarcus sp.]|jgi:D-alanyl-D-alanine carboxypeptidase/D-alanyl-D-alanine-endopeptidase (penicillin-binding protein 4)|nr:D-alanyl-D-alanine carboxypeptidase/D-alanyl-D-alanine-endopeptidase [Azoarcus sp.]